MIMNKSEIGVLPEYYSGYVDHVPDIEVREALKKYGVDLIESERRGWEKIGDYVYAPGKWTVKEIIQHMIDTERIFAYRALRIARGDQTPLPGFDQDDYAKSVDVKNRLLDDLVDEMISVRRSTCFLFDSLDDKDLRNKGYASQNEIDVIALGYIICGHFLHHNKIIRERYILSAK